MGNPQIRKSPEVSGKALVQLLIATGMTHTAIAEFIGSSWRSVYRWERGEAAPLPAHMTMLKQLVESRAQTAELRK